MEPLGRSLEYSWSPSERILKVPLRTCGPSGDLQYSSLQTSPLENLPRGSIHHGTHLAIPQIIPLYQPCRQSRDINDNLQLQIYKSSCLKNGIHIKGRCRADFQNVDFCRNNWISVHLLLIKTLLQGKNYSLLSVA